MEDIEIKKNNLLLSADASREIWIKTLSIYTIALISIFS